jgi:hypothetical protein
MHPVRVGLAALAILAASAHADKLKDHLSVFFEMEPADSVVALEQKSASLLVITVADPATGKTRTLKEEVGAKPMEKLLTESNDLGIKTLHWSPPDEAAAGPSAATSGAAAQAHEDASSEGKTGQAGEAAPSEASAAPRKHARSLSSERKNRLWYIATQTPLSTYVYGVAIPNAYDGVSTKARIATPMIVAPFAFAANFWFAKNHAFEDANLKGTTYLSIASLYASHALAFGVIDWDSDPYRYASFLSMAAYPLGIWGGYELGEKYLDLPGRIDTQEKFALSFGLIGFFSPFLYFAHPDGHSEAIIRLALGQSVALATAGHFLADQYRSGENIPDGVNTGIVDHTVLGVATGLGVAAIADAQDFRPWVGSALLGGTVGFMEGLYYYRNSYDSKERGMYNSLGALAGTMLGGGIAYLASDADNSEYKDKVLFASLLVAGTWLGYCATNLLTDGMEDRGARRGETWSDRLALNLVPLPEPVLRDREMFLRYRVPGVSYTF